MPDERYRASQEGDHDVFPCVWYAVGWSKELKPGRLLRKRIAGRDFILFRDSAGTVQALHAYCPHRRGADLSLGSCEGELNGRKPEPPSLFPELDDPDLMLAPYDAVWEAHLTRVIESVIDVAHVPIVHRRTIGRNSSSSIHIDLKPKETGSRSATAADC